VAKTIHVAPQAKDGGDGSKERPYASLQKAAKKLKGGDTLELAAGRYSEDNTLSFENVSASADKPITVSASPGAEVIIDGSIIIKNWKKRKGGIWEAKVERDIYQLTSEDELMVMARWPNASFKDDKIFRMASATRLADRKMNWKTKKYEGKTKPGLVRDTDWNFENQDKRVQDESGWEGAEKEKLTIANTPLAKSGISFKGAVAVINSGHWLTWAREVIEHKNGSDSFTYDHNGTQMRNHIVYYFLGRQALDTAGEWWYDKESKTVSIIPLKGTDPNKLTIRGQVRDLALLIINAKNICIKNVTFSMSAPFVVGGQGIVFEDCRFLYSSSHKWHLGDYSWNSIPEAKLSSTKASWLTFIGEGDLKNNVIRNCEFSYINAPVVANNFTLENNYFHHLEWDLNSSSGSGSVFSNSGQPVHMIRNTIHTCGNSEGLRPGGKNSLLTLNHISDMGLLQFDGSGINVGVHALLGTEVSFNWSHDTAEQGVRFDAVTKLDFHNMKNNPWYGTGGSYHHNVIWNSQWNQIKGESHMVYNNVAFNIRSDVSHITVLTKEENIGGYNYKTLVRNNMALLATRWWASNPEIYKLSGVVDHNITKVDAALTELRGPLYYDFRPKLKGEAHDAGKKVTAKDKPLAEVNFIPAPYEGKAPDIGAYEAEAKVYWIPGARGKQASTPVPFNGATAVGDDADLMWLGAYRVTTHNVYLATSAKALAAKPNADGKLSGEKNIFTPKALKSGQTYFWRVDAVAKDGSIQPGPVWQFTVEQNNRP
jgi:hypothetical protein